MLAAKIYFLKRIKVYIYQMSTLCQIASEFFLLLFPMLGAVIFDPVDIRAPSILGEEGVDVELGLSLIHI